MILMDIIRNCRRITISIRIGKGKSHQKQEKTEEVILLFKDLILEI